MARKVDLTVKVSQSVVDALDLIVQASKGEKTRSELVRQALDHFLIEHAPASKGDSRVPSSTGLSHA